MTTTTTTASLPAQKHWPNTTLLAQGAEARVYLVPINALISFSTDVFSPPSTNQHEKVSTPENKCLFSSSSHFIYKHRLSKSYRHPSLDRSILSSRLSAEARNILRALQCGIQAPFVFRVESDSLWMEYINGIALRNLFENVHERVRHVALCRSVGWDIATMHKSDLIHGDLTTSNLMVRYKHDNDNTSDDKGAEVDWERPVFIDFGLSYVSAHTEDKAVDLYVLERAILSTHKDASELFKAILEGYQSAGWEEAKAVIKTFEAVRLRGRKREMVG
uniref:non-specific serine/threonine protein kinase n=1 Tax=Percolomonas cosmopolitus TaxID=63605 RepID=A0A7S1PFS0_9EUKA